MEDSPPASPENYEERKEVKYPWREEEDATLKTIVAQYDYKNWNGISGSLNQIFPTVKRTGKQCRERWHNQLDPRIEYRTWNEAEERVFLKAHKTYGNKWREISNLFQGRKNNRLKNHFYSLIRKVMGQIKRADYRNFTELEILQVHYICTLIIKYLGKSVQKETDVKFLQRKRKSNYMYKLVVDSGIKAPEVERYIELLTEHSGMSNVEGLHLIDGIDYESVNKQPEGRKIRVAPVGIGKAQFIHQNGGIHYSPSPGMQYSPDMGYSPCAFTPEYSPNTAPPVVYYGMNNHLSAPQPFSYWQPTPLCPTAQALTSNSREGITGIKGITGITGIPPAPITLSPQPSRPTIQLPTFHVPNNGPQRLNEEEKEVVKGFLRNIHRDPFSAPPQNAYINNNPIGATPSTQPSFLLLDDKEQPMETNNSSGFTEFIIAKNIKRNSQFYPSME